MPADERVAVVGAGIIGCAIAFELAHRGLAVTVYEAERVAFGATHASAGILAPYTEAHSGGSLFDLTVRGLAEYDAFVARVRSIAKSPFEFRKSGTLEIAEDADRVSELQARMTEEWAKGAQIQWLDAGALRDLEPAVASVHLGGLLCPVHAHVAVIPFVDALVDAARALGTQFLPGVRVERVELTSGGAVLATSEGTSQATRVVLCAGAWSERLDPFGELAGRTKPIRGQLLRLRWAGPAIRTILWSRNCYIVPWDDGTLLVGATAEDVGFDDWTTAGGVAELLGAAREILPALDSAEFVDVRAGLRPATIEGLPIIGPSAADRRLLYATGHFRNGILLAPLTARLIADAVQNGA